MQVNQWLVLSTLALAAGTVLAQEAQTGNSPPSRREVRQSVLDARASHQLRPAGEAGDQPIAAAQTFSTLSRAEVKREVLEARAAGQLAPAGEAGDQLFASAPVDSTWQLGRAEVKAETLRARRAGELIPAGEGDVGIATHYAYRPVPDGNRMAMARRARAVIGQ